MLGGIVDTTYSPIACNQHRLAGTIFFEEGFSGIFMVLDGQIRMLKLFAAHCLLHLYSALAPTHNHPGSQSRLLVTIKVFLIVGSGLGMRFST